MEYRFIAVVVLSLGLTACDDSAFGPVFGSVYDPVPFRSDLLFAVSQDGSLNMPIANPNDVTDPKVAMNALDDFFTSLPTKRVFTAKVCSSFLSDEIVSVFKLAGLFNGQIANRQVVSIHHGRADT